MKKNNNKRRKPRRMTVKERKEQALLSALDDVYSAEDPNYKPVVEEEKQQKKPKQHKNKNKKDNHKKKQKSKTIIYIDGENAFFQIFDELRRKKVIRHREDLVKFDLRGLLESTTGEKGCEIRYYGAKLHEESSTKELLQRTQKMIDHKRRWIGFLSSQNIEFINAGELRIRQVINPYNKREELNFEEKGVDVKLAVDLVDDSASKAAEKMIVVSSDTDLQSAILAAQKHGLRVGYVSHDSRTNDTLIGTVDETSTFSSKDIINAFKRVNNGN